MARCSSGVVARFRLASQSINSWQVYVGRQDSLAAPASVDQIKRKRRPEYACPFRLLISLTDISQDCRLSGRPRNFLSGHRLSKDHRSPPPRVKSDSRGPGSPRCVLATSRPPSVQIQPINLIFDRENTRSFYAPRFTLCFTVCF